MPQSDPEDWGGAFKEIMVTCGFNTLLMLKLVSGASEPAELTQGALLVWRPNRYERDPSIDGPKFCGGWG
jgi:hypothetical protein